MKKNFSVKTIASAIFAATVLFTACNEKSPEALYDSGLRYVKGDGVEKNVEKGVSLLKKSANKGYLPAFRQVGSALMNNGSIQEGLSWCELAIEKGDAKTARDIAHTYYTGNSKYDIQKDYKKAVSLFHTAIALDEANSGDCYACLGDCYYQGLGVETNYDKAFEYYHKASSFDETPSSAYATLGILYYNGYGVNKDYKKAVEWFTKAAEQGNAYAQCYLGYCYVMGHGVNKDQKKAVEWYTKAANQGDKDAMKNLSICYRNGWGVKKDMNLSDYWKRKADEL